ncbi:hypothetical protein B0H19DRAFT_1371410 [Mycena capillaripes]|nr:hypothetical protein B0H19DRAFT_1371410 [Mycena capillaripes]
MPMLLEIKIKSSKNLLRAIPPASAPAPAPGPPMPTSTPAHRPGHYHRHTLPPTAVVGEDARLRPGSRCAASICLTNAETSSWCSATSRTGRREIYEALATSPASTWCTPAWYRRGAEAHTPALAAAPAPDDAPRGGAIPKLLEYHLRTGRFTPSAATPPLPLLFLHTSALATDWRRGVTCAGPRCSGAHQQYPCPYHLHPTTAPNPIGTPFSRLLNIGRKRRVASSEVTVPESDDAPLLESMNLSATSPPPPASALDSRQCPARRARPSATTATPSHRTPATR